jgi:propanol-preferring alcohol dehydrogenase
MVISEDFAYEIPERFADLAKAAPLMCSGVIGYRSLKLTGMEDGKTLGLYGFGAAHHLVIQMANFKFPNSKKFVISRNPQERELAKKLGADWVGDIEDKTPEKLDCAIDTTPVWKPTLYALENLEKGGRLIINLIRKEEIDKDFLLKLDYPKHLWLEKEVKTVANVTRRDAEEFLALAAQTQIEPEIQSFTLEEANAALVELKSGKIRGAKVLRIAAQ